VIWLRLSSSRPDRSTNHATGCSKEKQGKVHPQALAQQTKGAFCENVGFAVPKHRMVENLFR
jgi:hypothetical protein